MNTISIIMLVLAAVLLIGSCFVPDNKETQQGSIDEVLIAKLAKRELTADEKQRISDEVDQVISNKTEEVLLRTEEHLNKIANEKIMSVDEFSGQILERLGKDNSDATFLYKMISDAKEELKTEISNARKEQLAMEQLLEKFENIDFSRMEDFKEGSNTTAVKKRTQTKTTGKDIQRTTSTETVTTSPVNGESDSLPMDAVKKRSGNGAKKRTGTKESVGTEETVVKEGNAKTSTGKSTTARSKSTTKKLPVPATENEKKLQTRVTAQKSRAAYEVSDDISELLETFYGEDAIEEAQKELPKDRILELYRKGHTIREISKELSMGQGEVKLVIELYKA